MRFTEDYSAFNTVCFIRIYFKFVEDENFLNVKI